MRILHTGDWHMNARLVDAPRAKDIVQSLERVAAYLDEYEVDVMVVAGDLFCDRSDRDALKAAVGEIKRIFTPFLTRDDRPGTIIAITGNHDNPTFFETLRYAMDLASTGPMPDGTLSTGRLHLFHRPDLVRIADTSGTIVQFLLMPYPTEYWLKGLEYDTSAGQHRAKQDRYTNYLRNELLAKKLEKTIPAVLVSHILVDGATTRQGYRLGIEQDVVFSPGDVPTELEYIAYGHIHNPEIEVVPNAPWIRYCGSVERLDAGERDDSKSVVIVDVGPEGRTGNPVTLPLPATPIHRFEFSANDNPEDAVSKLEADWRGHVDRERALVSVRLFYTPGVDAPDQLRQRLRDLFPRLYLCDVQPTRVGSSLPVTNEEIDIGNVAKTTWDYVARQMAEKPNREEVLTALRDVLAFSGEGLIDEAVSGQEVAVQ